jgi:hypothetical protein
MRRLLVSVFAFLFVNFTVQADVGRGVLLNDDDPYRVKATNGTIYKVEWYGGSIVWFQGDHVILTNDNGRGQMVSPDDEDKLTEVWVEEIEED